MDKDIPNSTQNNTAIYMQFVHKPRTLKNKIGKINTITYDNIFDKLHCFINEEIS